MKVLFDTNVLLDVLLERTPFCAASARAWTLAELGRLDGLAATLSFTNVFYILNKVLDRGSARNSVKKIRDIFTPAACDAWVINQAIDADLPDLEDAVQYFCALRAGADCILTRNAGDFPRKPVLPVLSPKEFLAQLRTE
jgi:predicted nucleic acid-binding protein